MPTISQKLTFQASGASKSLTNLTTKLNQASSAFAKLKTSAGGNSGQISKGGKALDTVEKKAKRTKKATESLTISWQTMVRVITTQIAVRSFATILRQLQEGVENARELGLAIAEIKSISGGDLGLGVGNLTSDIIDLSNTLGESADLVAEGVYQTLSNQVVDAADALTFYEKAAKLAAVTNADSKEVVDALSSVMNSYSLQVSDTDKVMDQLFSTIELGRIRMSELGNSLGRVLPLASQMGVQFDEVGAALAVMTRQGVKTNTATTQLRAVLQKLLRPSDALLEIYKRWGVEDGPSAIRAFGGLNGVLQKLQQETDFNVAKQGELFQRVRAVTSALSLGVNQGQDFALTQEKIAEATGRAAEEIAKFRDTAAFELTQAQTEYNNQWRELGEELMPMVTYALSVITNNLKFMDMVLGLITGRYTSVYEAQENIKKIQQQINDEVEEFKENATIEELDDYDELLEAAAKYYVEINKQENKLRDVRQKAIDAATDGLERAQKRITDGFKDSISELESLIEKAENIWSDTFENIAENQQAVDDRVLENRLTNAQNGFNKLRILEEEIAKQREKANKALGSIDASEKSKEAAQNELKRLDSLFRQAERIAEQEKAYGKVLEYQEGGVQALNDLNEAETRYATAVEKSLPALKDQLEIQKRGETELNKLFEARLDLVKQINDANKGGDPKIVKALVDQLKSIDKDIAEVFKSGLANVDVLKAMGIDTKYPELTQGWQEALNKATFDWAREVDRAQAAFDKQIIRIKTAIDPAGRGERLASAAGLTQGVDETEAKFQDRLAKKAKEIITQESNSLTDMQAQHIRLAGLRKENLEIQKGLVGSVEDERRARVKTLEMASQGYDGADFSDEINEVNAELDRERQVVDQLLAKFKEVETSIQTGKGYTDEQKQALTDAVEAASKKLRLDQEQQTILQNYLVNLDTMKLRYEEINNIDAARPTREAYESAKLYLDQLRFIKARLAEIGDPAEAARIALNNGAEALLNMNTNAQNVVNATGTAATNTQTMKSAIEITGSLLPGVAGTAANLAGAFSKAADQAERMARAVAASSGGAAQFHGGPMSRFFAQGGFVRGQDKILTSLSAGETVINSKNSKRFFSELNAMNQGSEPVFREQGGPVTNVGDVNVTVQGGDSSQQTVREIGHALRREIQRGNIKLR